MSEPASTVAETIRALTELGGIGLSARRLIIDGTELGIEPASLRAAVKRVPPGKRRARAAAPAAAPADATGAAERAGQAVLGLLGTAAQNDQQIATQLAALPAADLARLARLVALAQEQKAGAPPSPVLKSTEDKLADKGVSVTAKAGVIHIHNSPRGTENDPDERFAQNRSYMTRRRWADRLGALKGFINSGQ
jgi:hypothetical protein